MAGQATISSVVLSGFDACLAARGVDPYRLGQTCGISERAWSDNHIEIGLSDFVDFLETGAAASAEPAFGWNAGRRFDLRVLGPLGEAILGAPNLGAALTTFANYLRLVQSSSELRLDVEADRAVLSYRILDPDIWPRQQDAEFSLSVFLAVVQRALGEDWEPCALTFEHGPSRTAQSWKETVGTECFFESVANTIVFPAAVLDRPMPAYDRDAWQRHSSALERALAQRNRARPTAARVTSAVFARLGRARLDQGEIASSLGLSRRTLHRRLEAEGTSFSEILNGCRLRLAQRQLAQGETPLSQLAIELGYSDQSAFTRAFRECSGLTPGAYRKSCRPASRA